MRVVQRREHFRLALKAREPIVIRGKRCGEDFDGDLALQLRVGRAIHFAHSTFAKLGKDLVSTDRLTDHKQVLSMATVDPPKLVQPSHASEGGPPAPIAEVIS
jgi:hypothetical protein